VIQRFDGPGLIQDPAGGWVSFDDYKALAVLTVHLRFMGDSFIAIPGPRNDPRKLGALKQFMARTGIVYAEASIPDAGEVEAFFGEWRKRLETLHNTTDPAAIAEHLRQLLTMKPPWGKVP
jgi:hypothetical protein